MKKSIKIFSKYFCIVLVALLLIFSFVGCQKEEPDGIKIQKSDDGISISGKYDNKSIDIEKSNKLDNGFAINGKIGDANFSVGNSDSLKDNKIKEFISNNDGAKGILGILLIIIIFALIGIIITIIDLIKGSLNKNNNKTIIQKDTAEIEAKKHEIKYNAEAYSKILNQDKTIYDYKEKSSELNKIRNLYKNGIYNEQEYKSKKDKWIESLKILNFNMIEVDFLNEIIVFVNDGIIENKELELIKYIVSGKYANDKYIEQQEQKIKAEEEARKKREEIINNIKDTTKEITTSTISKTVNTVNEIKVIVSNNFNKRVVSDNKVFCECGYEVEKEDAFCIKCGKKLK